MRPPERLGAGGPPGESDAAGQVGEWEIAATCARGLEGVLADELRALEAGRIRSGMGVVTFSGGSPEVVKANLWLRTAMRVVVRLAEGSVEGRGQLYDLSRQVPWERWLAPGQTLAVECAGRSRAFENTAFASLVVKDAIVDRIRERRGCRPDVDRRDPDVRIHLHLRDGWAGIGLDSSGAPLSHRGYRPRGGPAPLAESLAAGILLLAGFDGSQPFLDPMCGTGTLPIEAALVASRTAPGLHRSFACERWWFLEEGTVTAAREEARERRREPTQRVAGSDMDRRAVAASRANAAQAGVGEWCRFSQADVRQLERLSSGTVIVCNPPYGQRLGDRDAVALLYRDMGKALKNAAQGCTAWILVGDRSLARSFGLRAGRRIDLFNGPIRCALLEFEIGDVSRNTSRNPQAP